MCGIAGFVEKQHDPAAAKVAVKAMADLIAYRGPDGEGYYTDEQAALGHRRLAIIDLDGGAQPMFTRDGRLAVVYNGEIYNFKDLRAELEQAGHSFATGSDTEVLLHGYEQWGSELPKRLRGMFAFAIWDKSTRTLFCARDIFGIKPFYYYHVGGLFLFASEIKCFLAHPGFKKELNEARLPDALSIEYLPDEETMFKNVYKLPGAHSLTLRDGTLTIERYYEITYHIDDKKTLPQWEEEIEKAFAESVAAHQIADVEVGCFLSSGVDSSLVVNEVAKGTPKVKSFSVGYAEQKYSELPFAQAFSREIGVRNEACTVTAEQFFTANRLIQWYLDEPMPNPAAVPLYFLAQNAARQVKVVLSGEGADELFGGYPLYCQAVHFARFGKAVPKRLRRALAKAARRLPAFKGKNFLRRAALAPWQRAMRANYVFSSPAVRDRYFKKQYRAPTPQTRFRRWFEAVPGLDEPTALQWVDMHTWMPCDILLKADRMSMANSLELRVPFLDREVLELALTLPRRYRCDGRHTKIALRAAARRALPESVAKRKKLGFPVPLDDWLRQEPYYTTVKEKFTGPVAQKFFNTQELCRLLADHRAGRGRHMTRIWSFYSFILWYELYFVADAPPAEIYGANSA